VVQRRQRAHAVRAAVREGAAGRKPVLAVLVVKDAASAAQLVVPQQARRARKPVRKARVDAAKAAAQKVAAAAGAADRVAAADRRSPN
jgi:hypothetical protein